MRLLMPMILWENLFSDIAEALKARIVDKENLVKINYELELLRDNSLKSVSMTDDLQLLNQQLKKVNESLWMIEDDIRECEVRKDFNEEFIRLARAVYQNNDQRAALKKSINRRLGSSITEVKAYVDYSK